MQKPPTIHILLATYNGERFLTEQLKSIAQQSHSNWTLTVSDDGSTDKTLSMVERFAKEVTQPVIFLQGPRKGSSTANFVHLITHTTFGSDQDLYAFCDQDDVWDKEKLASAYHWHFQHSSAPFRLYCGRTIYVDEFLRPIGLSPDIIRGPSFGNALIQNIASGNTMVFNYAILIYLKKISPEHFVWHDWTTYLIATAMDGLVFFDKVPRVSYRQHSLNVIGSNNGYKSFAKAIKDVFQGRYKNWLNVTTLSVFDFSDDIPNNSLRIFNEFTLIRNQKSSLMRLLHFLLSKKIMRQSFFSNILFALALLLELA
jgi:glycosyltransferase involved in cell wall biosynthesis